MPNPGSENNQSGITMFHFLDRL